MGTVVSTVAASPPRRNVQALRLRLTYAATCCTAWPTVLPFSTAFSRTEAPTLTSTITACAWRGVGSTAYPTEEPAIFISQPTANSCAWNHAMDGPADKRQLLEESARLSGRIAPGW